jgi:hypothetical protein
MDGVFLSAIIAANVGRIQLATAARLARMQPDTAHSAVKLIDAAQATLDRLATLAAGTGGNLDISV